MLNFVSSGLKQEKFVTATHITGIIYRNYEPKEIIQ